jgi:hypothetical protein
MTCFVACLVFIPAYIFIAEGLSNALQVRNPDQRRLVFGAVIIPLTALVAFLEWRTGYYALRERSS